MDGGRLLGAGAGACDRRRGRCIRMILPPLRDTQLQPPVGTCARCGYELYPHESEICEKCKEEIENDDL